MPETRYRYEFPFQKKMPASLRIQDQPYLNSIIYEATSVAPAATFHHPTGEFRNPQYLKPYHAATIVDTRLDTVKRPGGQNSLMMMI